MEKNVSRRLAMALGLAGFAAPRLALAKSQPVLVELFTSQGCSSCPPADSVLGQIRNDEDVYAVSLNVDYWDYLGWRDTLAKPEYSKRQFDYGKARGDMQVYTPQVVINGRYHAVGNRRSTVDEVIGKGRASGLSVPVELSMTNSEIKASLPRQSFDGEATLWLMAIEPEFSQKIERGENTGTTVTYYNVVRNMVPAAMWKGEAFSGSWMRNAVMTKDCKSCIAVLQRDKTGPVLGLARV